MPKDELNNELNDGFDLIEYPTEFVFKAMCRASEAQSAEDHLREFLAPLIMAEALRQISTNSSRTGKFESVSIAVVLQSRDELEAIYERLAKSPRVVMTL